MKRRKIEWRTFLSCVVCHFCNGQYFLIIIILISNKRLTKKKTIITFAIYYNKINQLPDNPSCCLFYSEYSIHLFWPFFFHLSFSEFQLEIVCQIVCWSFAVCQIKYVCEICLHFFFFQSRFDGNQCTMCLWKFEVLQF